MTRQRHKSGQAIHLRAGQFGMDVSHDVWENDKPRIIKGLKIAGAIALTYWIGRMLHKNYTLGATHENKMDEMRLDAVLRMRDKERKFQQHIIEQTMGNKQNTIQKCDDIAPDKDEQGNQDGTGIEDSSHWMTADECISTANKVDYFAYTPIPKGCITSLWSRGGTGKTTLVAQIAVAIANGVSTGLEINPDGVHDTQQVRIYDSEDCISQRLTEYKLAGFSIDNIFVKTHCDYGKLEKLGDMIRQEIESATSSTTIIVDNITDCVDLPGRNTFRSVKKGLQNALRKAKDRGIAITIILVTHSESKGKRMVGSEIARDLSSDSIALKEVANDKILLVIDKSRNMPRKQYGVRRETSPYLHWVIESEDTVDGYSTLNAPSLRPAAHMPVTPDVEDMFLEEYIPNIFGPKQIYQKYKDMYVLKNHHTVRNAINRAKKRKAGSEKDSI